MSKAKPLFVIAGLGGDGRPHAARFSESEKIAATKAASLMGYRIGEASSGKPLAALRALPAGKIFVTGKALVPYIKLELFEQLTELVTLSDPPPADDGDDSHLPFRRPGTDPWAEIKSGDVVLCRESEELGWWEASVSAVDMDGTLTLRWRDYPKLKPFRRQKEQVALVGAAKQTIT